MPGDYELAFKIREEFMKIFIQYHRLWDWYGKWILYLQRIKDFEKNLSKKFSGYIYCICCVFLVLSIILLSKVPNVGEATLSLRDYLGFGCLYFTSIFFMHPILIDVVNSLLHELRYPIHRDLNHQKWVGLVCFSLASMIYCLGILFSIILFEYQLATNDSDIFSIYYSSIPMLAVASLYFLLFFILEGRSEKPLLIEYILIFYILFALPITYLFITLYFTNPHYLFTEETLSANDGHPGLLVWCLTIPMIPFEFAYFYQIFIITYRETYDLWRNYLDGLPIVDEASASSSIPWIPRKYLRLLAISIILLCRTMDGLLILDLNIQLGMNTLQLSKVFVIIGLLILCEFLTQGAKPYDRFYIN
jgi:hypothetical protein